MSDQACEQMDRLAMRVLVCLALRLCPLVGELELVGMLLTMPSPCWRTLTTPKSSYQRPPRSQ
jgi:hypothetical protein